MSSIGYEYAGLMTFQHWPIHTANWIGEFDAMMILYTSINHNNIQHALDVIAAVVEEHKSYPAMKALEPLNEPWQCMPIEELKQFYWEGYLIVKRDAPDWKYVMHDSFHFDTSVWGGFMAGYVEWYNFANSFILPAC
jgi:glucan 1,3-beta-glucosidase